MNTGVTLQHGMLEIFMFIGIIGTGATLLQELSESLFVSMGGEYDE